MAEMKQKLDRTTIALRVAREFKDGDIVNLGAGIPTSVFQLPAGRPEGVAAFGERGVGIRPAGGAG